MGDLIAADWLQKFNKLPDMKLASPITEVWTYVPHAQGVNIACT